MRLSLFLSMILCLILPLASGTARGEAENKACSGEDKGCLFRLLEDTAVTVKEDSWRDSTYRELAKLLARDNQSDKAVSFISRIRTPDTQALTIRGIGMAAASLKLPAEQYTPLFAKLTEEANKITHPPSQAIALTYVAMGQAFAGDDEGAMKTAGAMDNAELRNKAYYESSKVQAENGRLEPALASIAAIVDPGFRAKALRTVSKIRADKKDYQGALTLAQKIENPYQKSQAILYILTRQIAPEEVSLE